MAAMKPRTGDGPMEVAKETITVYEKAIAFHGSR